MAADSQKNTPSPKAEPSGAPEPTPPSKAFVPPWQRQARASVQGGGASPSSRSASGIPAQSAARSLEQTAQDTEQAIVAPSRVRFGFKGMEQLKAAAAATGFTSPGSDAVARGSQASLLQEEMSGLVTEIRLYNSWGVGKAIDSGGQAITIRGDALKDLEVGQRYLFKGSIQEHPKYGKQFDVMAATPDMNNTDALVRHITNTFANVGQRIAAQLVRHHRDVGTLELLRDALIYAPGTVDFSPFTTRPVRLIQTEDSVLRRVRDSLTMRFSGMGVGQTLATSLAKRLLSEVGYNASEPPKEGEPDPVRKANDAFNRNPYAYIEHVENFGFVTADAMARSMGIERNDERRICAAVAYALREGCTGAGHVWLSMVDLSQWVTRIDPSLDPAQAIRVAVSAKAPIEVEAPSEHNNHQTRIYPRGLFKDQQRLASALIKRASAQVAPLYDGTLEQLDADIDQALEQLAASKGLDSYVLDPSQREAIIGVLTSDCSVHTITAGPGCGKTTIVEVAMHVLQDRLDEYAPVFCAPTGKAAKVLNNRIKEWGQAETIHRTLGYQGHFTVDASNPLQTRLVVADEQSMMGTALSAAFFDAIPAASHIIMLGDTGQLESIDPGAVLKTVLKVDAFDHHRLSTTHRNEGELLAVINEVGKGQCVAKTRLGVEFVGQLPQPSTQTIGALANEVLDAAKKYGGLDKVGVICPVRKGNAGEPGWNVTHLNAALKAVLNPESAATPRVRGTTFNLNDRIIVTRNMMVSSHDARPRVLGLGAIAPQNGSVGAGASDVIASLGAKQSQADNPFKDLGGFTDETSNPDCGETYVVNGDTGYIVEAVTAKSAEGGKSNLGIDYLVLALDDGRYVRFPGNELENLSPSYAITVHAAQGSEYNKVFAVVTDGNERFMSRSMMFTQFSRAQKDLKVYGEPDVLQKVAQRPGVTRNCGLLDAVRERLDRKAPAPDPMPEQSSVKPLRERAA